MRPERWWSVVLTLGLVVALAPLSAQAGPNRGFAPQPNRRAFTPPQPRGHANTWNRQPQQRQVFRGQQPHRWQQPRGQAYGWNGQHRQWQQPRGQAHGWNRQQHRQWQQPHGQAYGWNNQHRQWQQPHGRAHAWNGQQHQGQQTRGQAYGWNGPQRPGNSQHQWQQRPAGGQHNNPGSPYNRAGYPEHPQSPNIAPNSSGYPHNTSTPASQTGARNGFRQPGISGDAPRPQAQTPSGVI